MVSTMEKHEEDILEGSKETQRLGLFAPFRRFLRSGRSVASWGKAKVTRRRQPVQESLTDGDDSQSAASTSESRWPLALPNVGALGFLQRRGNASATQQGKLCFPQFLTLSSSGLAPLEERQELVAVGSRHFGHPAISSLIRVKIYDFAMYMDGKQAKDSLVRKQYGRLLQSAPQDDLFYQRLRSSSDVKMALMVRASRNLPIKLLAGEYERILRRRLAVVGGSPEDTALKEMVRKFREEQLPDSIKSGKSVRKGTVLVFTRDQAGYLSAKADHHDLITVQSKPLCDAIFDLYIGDQPVSKKAKRMTGESFARLVTSDSYTPPREPMVCDGDNVCQL